MKKIRNFLEVEREDVTYQSVEQRVQHFCEFSRLPKEDILNAQASRCMDCGVPFCHSACPVNNQIPDWNELVTDGMWQNALLDLHVTNNFPEFTGRVCPAPCEEACTLNLTDNPVTIKNIELAIVEKGYAHNWIHPVLSQRKRVGKIAVIGSGPAGLAAAQDLARLGYEVTVYEKEEKAGGLLRYGIPDFKLEKRYIDRRLEQLQAEGVTFICNTEIGKDIHFDEIESQYDRILLAGGSNYPRDMCIPGRSLKGIHYAMDYLVQQNKRTAKEVYSGEDIDACDKHVIVIGGGDTGSDCIGTANRQKAASIRQFIIQPCPPAQEDKLLEWPHWPLKLRTSTSQQEGCERQYTILTTGFKGDDSGCVKEILCAKSSAERTPISGTEFSLRADLVFIAIGYARPIYEGLIKQTHVNLDKKGNVLADDKNYVTNKEKIFVAGDMRRGQSLVVWAIREGKQAAMSIHHSLLNS